MKKFLSATFFYVLLTTYYVLFPRSGYAFSDTTFFIHQDHLGSVVAVSDEEGNLVSETKYEAYGDAPSGASLYSVGAAPRGRPIGQTQGSAPTERGYTAQIKDQNTALQYYNARYYDPVLSRFTSADSAGGGNRFAYVGGNPVMANDPSGNKEEEGWTQQTKPLGYVDWQGWNHEQPFADYAAGAGMGKNTWNPNDWNAALGVMDMVFTGGAIGDAYTLRTGNDLIFSDQEKAGWAGRAFVGAALAIPFVSGSQLREGTRWMGEKLNDAAFSLVKKYGDILIHDRGLSEILSVETTEAVPLAVAKMKGLGGRAKILSQAAFESRFGTDFGGFFDPGSGNIYVPATFDDMTGAGIVNRDILTHELIHAQDAVRKSGSTIIKTIEETLKTELRAYAVNASTGNYRSFRQYVSGVRYSVGSVVQQLGVDFSTLNGVRALFN